MGIKLISILVLVSLLGIILVKISSDKEVKYTPTFNSPSPTQTPSESVPPSSIATPQPSPEKVLRTISLNQETNLTLGESVALAGTDIKITLMLVAQPYCQSGECPIKADLLVTKGRESITLEYNILPGSEASQEVLERARRKEAFGYTFIAAQLTNNTFTLKVTN